MATYAATSSTPPFLAPLDTDEVVDVVWDWSAQLTADGADTIAESAWTLPGGGNIGDAATSVSSDGLSSVTPDAPSIIETNTKTKAWLWFPTAGTYTIENTILTNAGRVFSKSAKVVVGVL